MPSLEAIKKLVALGAGVALVPKLPAQSEIESGQLVGLPVKEMKFPRQLNIIYRRNGDLSHAAKSFSAVGQRNVRAELIRHRAEFC